MIRYTTFDFTIPEEDRPYYIRFGAKDLESGKSVDFFTNKIGEGYFTHQSDGTYSQLQGTSQFEMPYSKPAQRHKLKNLLAGLIEGKAPYGLQ